jgi:M6 family metalloprotease-like protein
MRGKLARALALVLFIAAAFVTTAADAPPASASQSPSLCNGLVGDAGAIDYDYYPRPIGVVKALMFFVDFPDAPAPPGSSTEPARANLVTGAAEWFSTSSYGRLQLQVTAIPGYVRMPNPSTSYQWDRNLTADLHANYIRDAVTAADPSIDFSGYQIYYIVPNPEATAISFSPAYVSGDYYGIRADGATIGFGATFGQDHWDWGFGVTVHETSHLFGLPDLYFEGEPQHRFVGGWDIMGDIFAHSPDHMAWFKWQMGWLTDAQITCINDAGTEDVVLTPLETPGGRKAVVLRTGPRRVTVAEFRTYNGVDANACDAGVLVYTINTAVPAFEGPVVVRDAYPGTAANLPEGCVYEQDDASRVVGSQDWVDTANGIRISVVSMSNTAARIRITRTTSYPADVQHVRKLSLATTTSGSFVTLTGKLTATPALTACIAGRSVQLQQEVGGAWKTIRTANTNSSGVWTYRFDPRAARYRLVAPAIRISGTPGRYCTEATSRLVSLR